MNLKQLLQSIRESNFAVRGPRGNRPDLQKVFNRVKRAALSQVHNPKHPDKKKISKAEAEEQLHHDTPARKA